MYKRQAIDLAKHGFVMCISDTKGSHADLTDDYAAIRREMESVAAQFGKKVLRDFDEDEFYKAIPQLRKVVGDRAVVRAIHFYNDSVSYTHLDVYKRQGRGGIACTFGGRLF